MSDEGLTNGGSKKGPSKALIGAVGLLIGAALGFAGGFAAGGDQGESDSRPRASATPKAPEPEPEPVPEYEPVVADFEMTHRVKEQTCYGSAGCNVTLGIEPGYRGTSYPDPSVTWEVTYEIRGIEDAPKIGTFTISDDQFSFDPEARVQTARKDDSITIEVTSVNRGY